MKEATFRLNMESDSTVRLDLVSGFRGAGKTRLLLQLAQTFWKNERVLLLQNELGRTKLSPQVLPENCRYAAWQGGCICCTDPAVFTQALMTFRESCRPQRIVIELAQTARLSDTKAALAAALDDGFTLEHSFYVLNAASFDSRWELSGAFLSRQLEQSPAVWLTNAAAADEALLARIRGAVAKSNPRCTLLPDTESTLQELCAESRVYKKIRFHERNLIPSGGRRH